ncbi:MAG TPA: hypothetical protein VER08_05535 [Pyrinomonadaceae bacterium]|nr:hypothetical protein [Pyrinomonadaceae bacterium]
MRLTRRQRAAEVDGEATLVSPPRFDEAAAQRAHRVVPLRDGLTAVRRDPAATRTDSQSRWSAPPTNSARWGDLLPRRTSRGLRRAATRARGLAAADWKPALVVIPMLLAAVIAGLALAKQERAQTAEATNAAGTTQAAEQLADVSAATDGEAPGQFMVVPVIRPAESSARKGSRRPTRVNPAGVEGEVVGEFVIPAEAFEGGEERGDKKKKGRERRRAGELERIAERFGREREVRGFKDLLREFERD